MQTKNATARAAEEKTKGELASEAADFVSTLLTDAYNVDSAEHVERRDSEFSSIVMLNTKDGARYQLKITVWVAPTQSEA